jgi:membrane protein DedA with SNARE-associated domain
MLEHLIETYGYWAVLIGTFLEGETILVLAGFAAHQGYLQLPGVMLAACIGSLAGDQLLFYLGRRHSDFVLRRRPAWKQRFTKVEQKLMRHRNLFLISFRFLYGLRTVTPFMVGMSSVPTLVFVFLNAFSALLWAVAIGSGGYLFGRALELVLGKIKSYEIIVGAGLALAGLLIWLIHGIRRRRNKPV